MATRVVSATEFKVKCSAFLDEVQKHGTPIVITKRGLPVAVLSPSKTNAWKSPRNRLAGKAQIIGDIVNYDTSDQWEVLRNE
jgi:prevent-host-death family protein